MLQASNSMNFEKALEYKNMIDDIKITLKNQTIVLNKDINLDIFNYYEHDSYLAIQVFFIRSGTLFERHQKIIEGIDKLENIIEYIINFYDKHILTKEILVPDTIDAKILEDYFHIYNQHLKALEFPVKLWYLLYQEHCQLLHHHHKE